MGGVLRFGGRPSPTLHPAQVRLLAAQAHALELQAHAQVVELRRAAAVRSALDVLPSCGTLAVLGPPGSGKTTFAAHLSLPFTLAKANVSYTRATLPPPPAEGAPPSLEVIDDAGHILQAVADPKARDHVAFRDALATSRHRNVLRCLLVQSTTQVPPSVLALGIHLVVVSAPLLWRVFQRPEARELLDRAAQALANAPELPTAVYALVQPGGTSCVFTFPGATSSEALAPPLRNLRRGDS